MRHPIIETLRRERRLREMSQDAVSAAIDYSQHRVSVYEAGRNFPRLDILEKWADTLGYEIVIQPKKNAKE